MAESLQLRVQMDGAPPEELVMLNRELMRWINDTAPGVEAAPVPAPPPGPGAKGADLVTTLVIGLANASAITALVQCIATYIKERRRQVVVEVSAGGARNVRLEASNLGASDVSSLMERITALVRATPGAPIAATAAPAVTPTETAPR